LKGRPDGKYPIQRLTAKKYGNIQARQFRRPFWLPAPNYYILAMALTIAFFFFVWAILHEGNEETPVLVAGIGASIVLGSAVVLREIFLRKARNRYLLVERKLDYNVKGFPAQARLGREQNRLSLEKNAAIVKDIQKKSEAARILGKISSGHLEVFEVCNEYLSLTEKQMETVGVGSPRIAALRRGREIVSELHRYHLLTWAEIESRSLTQKAKNYVTISEKLNTAQEALTVLDSALQFYPNDPQLTESETALKDFISSMKVSHWIEQAERAAFKGNYNRAISLYRDALFFLAREDVKTEEREAIAEKINVEIESLRGLAAEKEINKELKQGSK
jgi:tetratricopeptide (TPR) repeat protein